MQIVLVCADRQKDGQTAEKREMTKLIVVICNSVNVPKYCI
jgi:hypothetical protein